MMRKTLLIVLTALMVFATAQTSQAVLTAVDPGTPPGTYSPAFGYFPIWYSDPAQQLELCLSKTAGLNGPMCILLANPGIFDPTLPIVFPLNFPDESFYFIADAFINDPAATAAGVNVIYRAALEAAFASGAVINGDQVTFARIRIRADVPVAGAYTIDHPFGTENINVAVPGRRAINITADVGIGAPGVFTGALAGALGPFLVRAGGPITITNPDGTTETFIGDPNILEPVVGGPNGNIVSIKGPGGINFQTTLFNLAGKVRPIGAPLPTVLSVDRSTYSRSATATHVDVFATSSPVTTTSLSFTEGLTATSTPMAGDGTGKFYGQSVPTAIPQFVIVTATDTAVPPASTPTPLASQVVDVVKITKAQYRKADPFAVPPVPSSLIIEASSSDQVAIPTLTALGFGTLSVVGVGPTQSLVVSPLDVPPARVTVKSSLGGSDTEPVVIVGNLSPIANNDTATATACSATVPCAAVNILVLNNDSDPDGALNLASVTIVTAPANGTAAVNTTTGTVDYTPNQDFGGIDTFIYTVADNLGAVSNVATVTVTVAGLNAPPTLSTEPLLPTTSQRTPVDVFVLANAVDGDPGHQELLVISAVTQPVNGTAVISAATLVLPQRVTYTPSVGFAGPDTFTYTIADPQGATVTGTVTVTVNNITPVANPDTATTTGAPVTIIVLANDTDPGGDALTVTAVSIPANGTAGISADGLTVTYTPNAAFNGPTDTFTYTVIDHHGGTATATVTVTVNRETITATGTVKVAANLATAEWNLQGTTSIPAGNRITVAWNGRTVGSAVPDRRGKWQLRLKNSPVVPPRGTITITVSSAFGTVATFPITVQ